MTMFASMPGDEWGDRADEFECRFCGEAARVDSVDRKAGAKSAKLFGTPYLLRCDGCDNGFARIHADGAVVPV